MKNNFQNNRLSLNLSISLVSIICLSFYISFLFGCYLARILNQILDTINLSKSIKFRKKLNIKNIMRLIFNSFCRIIQNWLFRIYKKSLLVAETVNQIVKALQIIRKKFKSILDFKYNLQLLKKLLYIIFVSFQILMSLINEVAFPIEFMRFLIEWRAIISLLMTEYKFLTQFIYVLYLILLGLVGGLFGFIYIMSKTTKREEEIYVLTLLFLLRLLYFNGFDYALDFNSLKQNLKSLKANKISQFSKFSLRTVSQPSVSSPKILMPEFCSESEIILPILGDPFIVIETDFIWEQSQNYKFELFKFYKNVNDKVKS